jgi:hypothetical protein
MPNESKKNIIQVSAFLRGAIQGPVWAEAVLKQLFNAVGDVMALGQSRPPVGELLPFDGIGSHDAWIKSEACGHGTIR